MSLRTLHSAPSSNLLVSSGSLVLASDQVILFSDWSHTPILFSDWSLSLITLLWLVQDPGDTDSLSGSCDSKAMLVGGEGAGAGQLKGAKHRRKIIAIPVGGAGEGGAAQGYRELGYSESYHEAFLAKPIGEYASNLLYDPF